MQPAARRTWSSTDQQVGHALFMIQTLGTNLKLQRQTTGARGVTKDCLVFCSTLRERALHDATWASRFQPREQDTANIALMPK